MKIFRTCRRAVNAENRLEVRQRVADLRNFFHAGGVGDQRLDTGVGQPVTQGVDAEQREQRHGDCADLVGREMGYRGFRFLWQEDADTVAGLHAAGGQQIRRLVRQSAQVGESVAGDGAVATLMDQREPRGIRRPFVAKVDTYVVERRDLPGKLPADGLVAVEPGQHVRVRLVTEGP